METRPSRQAKDHLFVDLFNQPKYCLALFKALHPEVDGLTEADIQNITISHVIVDKPYNDLGFTVRGRLLVLVEAQATWSYNILIRILLYLADTLLGIINDHEDWDIHARARLPLPVPEFYVIYTGDRKRVPEQISLSKDFFKDASAPIDLTARVISAESTEDIIGQYIIYAHVFDRQIKKYGYRRIAAEETIRICRDMGVLKEYLNAHEKEVVNSMIMLFEQEEATRRYGNRRAAEAMAVGMAKGMAKGRTEGRAEGRAEGRTEGRTAGKLETYAELVSDGTLSPERAAEKLGMSVEAFNAAVKAAVEA